MPSTGKVAPAVNDDELLNDTDVAGVIAPVEPLIKSTKGTDW